MEHEPFANDTGDERVGHIPPFGHLLWRPHQDVLGGSQANKCATVAGGPLVTRQVRGFDEQQVVVAVGTSIAARATRRE